MALEVEVGPQRGQRSPALASGSGAGGIGQGPPDNPGALTDMHPDTSKYNAALMPGDQRTCELLAREIDLALPEAENKVWHAHPVWFLEGNPVVGYSKLKDSVRLLFWSGQSFSSAGLRPEGRFQAAEARFDSAEAVDLTLLRGWLRECRDVQWDYKNIVKRKGRLERLK